MRLPDYPVPGEAVRASWGRMVVDCLRALTPKPSTDIVPTVDPGGSTFKLANRRGSGSEPWTFKKPFDLEDVGKTSFSVMANGALTGGLWLDGVHVSSLAVSGLTWSSDRWVSGTISAAQYVYIERDHIAATTTLKMAAALPDGAINSTTAKEPLPLWYVGWRSGDSAIDIYNTLDLRNAPRLFSAREMSICVGGETEKVRFFASDHYA